MADIPRRCGVIGHYAALLTRPGSRGFRRHKVGGEALFPRARCGFCDAAGGMIADPLQCIDEVGVRIDAVSFFCT
jgi:hypothetical protein